MSATEKAAVEQAVDMVNIEVNGVALQAPKGSMIIESTDRAGIEIPRFCYHPKLSIAANCRMCLVDVEKMPKPVPACATPVMEGMKIYTDSRRAIDAQHGVMEFLLINHPLDCPICDQGGECELQDLAMGYGRSVSRFTERKRVVKDKNVGPLVQTDMTRCIHCTRCVRFLEEVAGTCEMGGTGRGDRLEIGTAVETSIDSELSGNIIDLCPVGALTNKPFRYSARAWELLARPGIGLHDGVASRLFYHVRRDRVMRSVPREHEATNEAWLSDRDRFSHFGLYADDRVTAPQIKEDGSWKSVSWDEALSAAATSLQSAADAAGPEQLGFLLSPSATTEEYYLAQQLARGLGCGNIDHRLRQQDFSDDTAQPESPAFEARIADMDSCDAILLVGCNPRSEAPIIGHRVRQAWRKGGSVSAINPVDWPLTFSLANRIVVAPQHLARELAALGAAVRKVTGRTEPDALSEALDGAQGAESYEALAGQLKDAERGLLLLGQFAASHPDAAWLRALSRYVAEATGCALNLMTQGANSVGAWRAGAVPHRGPGGAAAEPGLDAARMLREPRRAYVLWGIEPEFDIDNPNRAMRALADADTVIAAAAFATDSLREIADVILPLAPHAESEGSVVGFDGDAAAFEAAVRPHGEARSGWKILRKLGGELGLDGFDQVGLADVQANMNAAMEAGSVQPGSNTADAAAPAAPGASDGLFRIGDVPLYSVDPLCRRSSPLQQTAQAQNTFVGLNPADAERLGLAEGARARVSQGEKQAEVEVRVTEEVPEGGAWLRSATCAVRELGPAVGPLSVEVA